MNKEQDDEECDAWDDTMKIKADNPTTLILRWKGKKYIYETSIQYLSNGIAGFLMQ